MAETATPADTFNALSRAGKAIRNPKRDAWTLSSSYSVDHLIAPIKMSINPSSAKFDQAKRISTIRRTIGGQTYFNWSDKLGRNLDPLIIAFSGETGTISGMGKTPGSQNKTGLVTINGTYKGTRAQTNAQNFARWYTLTTQPALDPTTFVPNIWTIRYQSLIFPDVLFSGFYNTALQFVDDAMSPFSKKYVVTFTVTAVVPDILEIQNWIGSTDVAVLSQSTTNTTAGEPPPSGNIG